MGNLSSSVSLAMMKGSGQYLVLKVKFYSGREMGFFQKFGPARFFHYTVYGSPKWKLNVIVCMYFICITAFKARKLFLKAGLMYAL